jgi:flagellar protein FlbD
VRRQGRDPIRVRGPGKAWWEFPGGRERGQGIFLGLVWKGGFIMIVLTKRNGERFLVNEMQISCIEMIPECKVVMMNHDYYLVLESAEEIVQRIAEYNAKVRDIQREITITDKR